MNTQTDANPTQQVTVAVAVEASGFVPTLGSIPDVVLRTIYASDQDMYPVALPYSRLRAWVNSSGDLSVCFSFLSSSSSSSSFSSSSLLSCPRREGASAASGGRDGGSDEDFNDQDSGNAQSAAVAGVVIVLPLRRRFWEDLLQGRLKEWEIEPQRMFAFPAAATADEGSTSSGDRNDAEKPQGAEEVGLHVYHIERFETAGQRRNGNKRFSDVALAEVMRRARARLEWKVVGMSALTATPAGKRTFERLGFSPTGYRELFVTKSQEQGTGEATNKRPPEIVYVYPGGTGESDEVVCEGFIATSAEMMVRYDVSVDSDGMDQHSVL